MQIITIYLKSILWKKKKKKKNILKYRLQKILPAVLSVKSFCFYITLIKALVTTLF